MFLSFLFMSLKRNILMFPFLKFYVHIVAVTVYPNSQNPPVARARSRSVAPPGIPARVPTSSRSESPTRTRAEGAAHRLMLIVPVQFAPRHATARGPLGSATQHLPGDGSHLCTGHHAAASVGQGLSVRGAPWWLPRSVLCSHGSCTRGHTHVIHRVERCADTSPGHSEADGAALGIGQSHGGWRKDVRML